MKAVVSVVEVPNSAFRLKTVPQCVLHWSKEFGVQ